MSNGESTLQEESVTVEDTIQKLDEQLKNAHRMKDRIMDSTYYTDDYKKMMLKKLDFRIKSVVEELVRIEDIIFTSSVKPIT